MANSKRRCRSCRSYSYFEQGILINGGYYCDIDCATTYAYSNKEKGKLIVHKEQKANLKNNDKRLRTNEAQKAFNAYIRFRDKDEPCISCQRHHTGQYHAGHFKTVGARPDLRFNEDNCHKQCAPCNNHLSGNIGEYIGHLIDKIGKTRFEALTPVKSVKYSCEELKQIELKYKKLTGY